MPPFNPTYKGKPLFDPSLDPIGGHFGYESSYEIVRAARWRGYTWQAFDLLEADEQALVIAEHRIEMRYQAVDAWEHRPKAKPPKTPSTPKRRRRR